MIENRPLRVLFIAFSRSSLGHVTRMRTAAARFAQAGHEVAVAAHEEARHLIERDHLRWIGIEEIGPAPKWRGMADPAQLRAFARTRLASPAYVETSLREELRVIDGFEPDAVVSDMRNTASVAASMRDLPSFTCHNLRLFRHPMHVVLPEILATLEEVGVAPAHARKVLGDALLVPDLPLLDPLSEVPAETAALVAGLAPEIRHIGPLVPGELRDLAVDADREPLLHIGLGGSGAGNDDLLRVVAATRDLDVRTAVTLGSDGPEAAELAARVREAGGAEIDVAAFRHDTVELMARSQAAVVHGGHSSMVEGLLCATPLVFVPHSAEQHGNAARVAALGLGSVIGPGDDAEAIASAIRSALEPADPAAHRDFASLLRRADGAAAMMDLIAQTVALHRIGRGES